MVGFSISNDAGTSGGTLTFTINGMTIPVKATETYEASFLPFKTVTISTTVPYRATVSAPYGATFDTIAPLNITGLVANNITTSDLILSWNPSSSSDTVGYDVYQGSTILATVSETTYGVVGLIPSTSYTFTIKAKDNSGNISSGTNITVSTLADTIAPNNVTNLVASGILATSLTLSWTASTSTDVVGYDVYNGLTKLTTVTGTTYNVTGLSSNTNYTFTVKAKDGYDNIASGSSVSATTAFVDTTAPNDVTGLTAGTATVNSIPVGWNLSSSSDVANYEVAYSSNGGSTWTIASALVNNSSTSYTITGLTTGTTYTIRVVAIDTSGNRSTGVTITKATASSATYTVSASPSSGTYNTTQNVTLSVAPSGATIYYTTNGSNPTTASSVYSTPIAVSANTTIKFFAQDGSGNATSVQTATYTIDTVAPTVTISPVAGSYNSTQSVQITSNEGTIYYTLDGTTPTVSSTVYSGAISVSSTQTVKYLVVDTAGNQTTGSATYTIDTASPDPVTNLTVGTVSSTTMPVTWTSPSATDVSKYEVAYSSDGGINYTIATSSLSAPATSYTVTGLNTSTTYTIRVVALDVAGNRSTPVTVSASTSAAPSKVDDASLLLYQDNPVNNTTISNADNYFNNNEKFTISITAKIPAADSVLLNRWAFGNDTGSKLNIKKTYDNKFSAQFYAKNASNATTYLNLQPSNIYSDMDSYYHIVVVRDNPNMTLYVNNVQIAQITTATDSININPSTLPLTLGQSGKSTLFKNIAYYNRALSTAELTQNYNALK
jgi:chitodextrinase